MANLKEIRGRIASVTSTRQITSAMKMVAAAKLRKAQTFVSQIVPYKNKMQEILSVLSESLQDNDNKYTAKREVRSMLVIAVSSNKGLCGGFNSNVFKYCSALMERELAANPKLDLQFYTIGKKITEQLEREGAKIYKFNNEAIDKVEYQACADIMQEVTGLFLDKKFDCVKLVYNEFVNPAVQTVGESIVLPLTFEAQDTKFKSDYIFEPDQETIVNSLIPQWLKTTFFSAMAESFAGEQGARMTSMNKATDNATELIKDLNLQYNKVRQASITNEIIEIVSGASANAS